MTRQQRQLAELRALCSEGRVGRAVDLAFEHFACFGSDPSVLALLAAAAGDGAAQDQLRRRLAELAALVEGVSGVADPSRTRPG